MLEMHDGGIVFRFPVQTRDLSNPKTYRPAPGSNQPLIQLTVRAFTPDIKRLGFEAHNSPTSEAKFKK